MITIDVLTGLVSPLLIYPALIALGSWLAGHLVRAIIIYVPKVKADASIAFRTSYWLMLIGLALATIAWVFLGLTHFAAPNSWWGEQSHWFIAFITASYMAPLVLACAIWSCQGLWVRLAVVTIALLYFSWCWITLIIGLGFFFSFAALLLLVASALRALVPPPAANAPPARRGGA